VKLEKDHWIECLYDIDFVAKTRRAVTATI
jgi:hypothetical protein